MFGIEIKRKKKDKKERNKPRMMKVIITICIAFITLYTVCEWYRVWKFGGDTSTLTTCVFGFFGTEIVCGAIMRSSENKYGGKDNGMDGK